MNYKVLESPRVTLSISQEQNVENGQKVALIGHLVGGERIRKYLNQFSIDRVQAYFCDLGNIISQHSAHAGNLVTDLVEDRSYLPLLIANSGMQTSFDVTFVQHFMNPTFISSRPQGTNEYQHIGLQVHLIPSSWDIDADRHLRLGKLQEDTNAAEVMLRNADYVNIDLNVLRYSDNPSPHASTAGLTIEELCMLAKYIGASTQLQAVIISGYNQHLDKHEVSARNIALIIWYLMDGFELLQREKQSASSEREYTVIPDQIDGGLTFVENQNSGRWWVEVYSEAADKNVRIACGKEDYDAACQNEVSDRLTSILINV